MSFTLLCIIERNTVFIVLWYWGLNPPTAREHPPPGGPENSDFSRSTHQLEVENFRVESYSLARGHIFYIQWQLDPHSPINNQYFAVMYCVGVCFGRNRFCSSCFQLHQFADEEDHDESFSKIRRWNWSSLWPATNPPYAEILSEIFHSLPVIYCATLVTFNSEPV